MAGAHFTRAMQGEVEVFKRDARNTEQRLGFRPGPRGRFTANLLSVAVLYGRTGSVTALFGGLKPRFRAVQFLLQQLNAV